MGFSLAQLWGNVSILLVSTLFVLVHMFSAQLGTVPRWLAEKCWRTSTYTFF